MQDKWSDWVREKRIKQEEEEEGQADKKKPGEMGEEEIEREKRIEGERERVAQRLGVEVVMRH